MAVSLICLKGNLHKVNAHKKTASRRFSCACEEITS